MEDLTTNLIPHPGEYIKEELEARGLNQRDLAFVLDCPEQAVTLILNGKRGISVEMAKQLSAALNVSPELFVNLQRAYDLAHAQNPNPGIAARAHMQSRYPLREMINRNWLKDGGAEELAQQLAAFFGVASANEIPYLAHAAKKTNYEEKAIPPEQLAWLFRVKQIAHAMPVPKYSPEVLLKAVDEMKKFLEVPDSARHVPRLLAESGVRFAIVEALPKSKIDGVAFWLDADSPAIGLSSRFDRIDNFWFVLRHEIEHILLKHGQGHEMIDSDLVMGVGSGGSVSEEERVATEAALDFCVPTVRLGSFIVRKQPFFSEKDVLAFSEICKVHPGLVVGQIQHRTGKYGFLRKYQVKIRQHIIPGAMSDGWGQSAPI